MKLDKKKGRKLFSEATTTADFGPMIPYWMSVPPTKPYRRAVCDYCDQAATKILIPERNYFKVISLEKIGDFENKIGLFLCDTCLNKYYRNKEG